MAIAIMSAIAGLFWWVRRKQTPMAGVPKGLPTPAHGYRGLALYLSPHTSDRRGAKVGGVVIHYTAGGDASGSIAWFLDKRASASAHFVISRTGWVVQCVPLTKTAWHAGDARWLGGKNVNAQTIGIELANWGRLQRNGDGWRHEQLGYKKLQDKDPRQATLTYPSGERVDAWWEPYPEAQLAALEKLLRDLRADGYPANVLAGHDEIALPAGRKTDPGPLFPWGRFRSQGATLGALVA